MLSKYVFILDKYMFFYLIHSAYLWKLDIWSYLNIYALKAVSFLWLNVKGAARS